METWVLQDPRLDHYMVSVRVLGPGVGPMPPLEALWVPVRIRMHKWKMKPTAWRKAVTRLLASEPQQ